MNLKQLLVLSLASAVVISSVVLIFIGEPELEQPHPQQLIGAIAQERLQLTDQKQNCLDELPYYESLQSSQGKTQLCTERDEKIQQLRTQHTQILDKPYKQALGLHTSR